MKRVRAAKRRRHRKLAVIKKDYSQTFLRVVIGALFFISGVMDIFNPSGLTGTIESFGIPGALFFAWLLILLETIFGLAVLVGWNTRYTVWPLVFIIVLSFVSLTAVVIQGSSFWTIFGAVWFNLIELAVLVKIYTGGAGALAFCR